MTQQQFVASLPQVILALALLALAGVLAPGGHLAAGSALAIIIAVGTYVGVTGGIVLGSPAPNALLIPHLIVAVAMIGLTAALGYLGVFTSAQVQAVVGMFVVLGGVAGGSSAIVRTLAAAPAAAPPPPLVPPGGTPPPGP